MENLEVFGIVMLSERFKAENSAPDEVTYATGFIVTDTVNRNELAKNPQWQKLVALGFYPVTIAKGPRHNFCAFQLFAIEGLPPNIREFVLTAAPVTVQKWLGRRLEEKYGYEALAEWNKACAAEQ